MTADQPSENQDLQEILNEIESLQADLRQTTTIAEAEALVEDTDDATFAEIAPEPVYTPTEAPAPVSALSGFELLDAAIRAEQDASVSHPKELKMTTPEIKQPVSASVPSTVASSPAGSEGSLTMNLKGNMTLTLNYECGGQSVTVSFGEQFLKVQLADGTEFKIPVGKHSHLKAA